MRFTTLTILIAILSLTACKKEVETKPPAEITNLVEYKDDATGLSIIYPEGWDMNSNVGKGMFAFSIPEAKSRFTRYDGFGDPVARLQLNTLKIDSTRSFDDIMDGKMIFDSSVYVGPSKIMLEDSIEAISYSYTFPLNDGEFKGIIIGATKDSVLATIFRFESFGNTYQKYQSEIDKMISSIKLAVNPSVSDTIYLKQELPLPSQNLVRKSGDGYTISIPDNFKAVKYKSAGTYARKYEGERRADSYVVVEVLKKSKKALKKIVELNAKQMKLTDVEQIKLNGQDAFMFEYDTRPGKNKRRIYFLKNGDIPFRIIADWSVEEESDYLPVFEKLVETFKMK
ncbi:hypothetical protein OAQ99_01985 [Candidatus Kapabacteria bacterium]|nr:hypothetical protein [Candidatus Kapabacteria bacterium]